MHEKRWLQLLDGITFAKDKAIHVQAWTDPQVSRRSKLSEFLNSRNMKAARLSALRTSRPGTGLLISVGVWVDPRDILKPEGKGGKAVPLQAWTGPWRIRLVKAPDFQDVRHMKVVGRQPYAPAIFTSRSILVLFFRGWVDPRAHGSVGSFGKNAQRHHCGSVGNYGKQFSATPLGIDPETLRLVAQCLNPRPVKPEGSMKNSNHPIGNRARYLPTCSAVPLPTAPPRILTFVRDSVFTRIRY